MLKEWLDAMVEEFSAENFNYPNDLDRKVAFTRFLQQKLNEEAGKNRPATQKELQAEVDKTLKGRGFSG